MLVLWDTSLSCEPKSKGVNPETAKASSGVEKKKKVPFSWLKIKKKEVPLKFKVAATLKTIDSTPSYAVDVMDVFQEGLGFFTALSECYAHRGGNV
jgi:hypothetical protein